MGIDVTTLTLAKAYTDEKVEEVSTGGVNLSNYAKKEEVYTKKEIDAMDFVTSDELPGGSIVDKTLTIEGQAADAKATGDRLGAIEYQTVTTDLAYEHKDLPEGEKAVTIQGDGVFGNTAYVGNFTNLVPNGGFSKPFPYRGITVAKKGDGYVLSGTSIETAPSFFFTDSSGNYDIPIASDLIGKTLVHTVFADSVQGNVSLSAIFLDENKAQLSKVGGAITTASRETVVPEGTAYIRCMFYCQPNIEYNHEFKFYLIEKEKFQSVTLVDGVAELQGITEDAICSVPYKHTAQYIVSLRKLIDDYAGGGNVTYLAPEDFGAVGDGSADDGTAIAECLNVASQTGQMVIMAKRYYINSPIVILQNDLKIVANDIIYSGTDCAIKIIGRKNDIKIHSIVSSGVGLGFYPNGTLSTSYNSIEVNSITSGSHGIAFYTGSSFIHQNSIKFQLIRASGDSCYGICFIRFDEHPSSFMSECSFYGGQIANCEWAVYNVGGNCRFYSVEIEDNVQGGFYTAGSGDLIIHHPRHAESSRDGRFAFYKFTGTQNVHIYSSSPLSINEIDLTDAIDVYANAAGQEYPLHEQRMAIINGYINCRIPRVGVNNEVANVYTDKAYIWGKYLILTPYMDYRKEITTTTLDTRLIQSTEQTDVDIKNLSALPTKFVVNTINSDIYLHSSYCAFGYSEFEVEQVNGYTCKVYDCLENLIFDGTEQGNGIYKFKVYKDATYCANNSSGALRRDFLGHYWQITKQIAVSDVLNALPTWSGGAY